MHSNYLKTDGFDGPNGTGDDFVAGGRGMFVDYAVHALWTDTTTMGTDDDLMIRSSRSHPTKHQ